MGIQGNAKSKEAASKRIRRIHADHSLTKRGTTKAMNRRGAELAAKWKERSALYREQGKFTEGIGAEFLGLLSEDARMKINRRAQEMAKRPKLKLKSPSMQAAQPRITTGSLTSILAPPYQNIWTNAYGGGTVEPSADEVTGTFGCYSNQGGNGSGGCEAGVMAAYQPISDQPVGHFRPYLKYSYGYNDWVFNFSTAHAAGTLYASVYEFDERGNLAVYPPSEVSVQMFNDTTGPNFTPETDQETEYGIWPGVLDVPFQIVPGFSYAMWVWCDVFADGGLFGNGNGGAEVVCPFMVVEEAQV